jgi:hypothetical protein
VLNNLCSSVAPDFFGVNLTKGLEKFRGEKHASRINTEFDGVAICKTISNVRKIEVFFQQTQAANDDSFQRVNVAGVRMEGFSPLDNERLLDAWIYHKADNVELWIDRKVDVKTLIVMCGGEDISALIDVAVSGDDFTVCNMNVDASENTIYSFINAKFSDVETDTLTIKLSKKKN